MATRDDCQKTAVTPFSMNRKLTLAELKCPPNPFAIRSIVFRNNNLQVIYGANTEISIPLNSFTILVDQGVRSTITLPGRSCNVEPISIYKLDLGGIDSDGEVKFIALLPNYGTSISSTSQHIQWAYTDAIESGELFIEEAVGPSSTSDYSFSAMQVNDMVLGVGASLSFTGGTGPLWIASSGGFLKYDGEEVKLWNTLNSELPSDYVNSVITDAYGSVWLGSSAGVVKFTEDSENVFTDFLNTSNSDILSDTVNDVKILGTQNIAIGTTSGLSIYNFVGSTFTNLTVYNSPSLKSNDVRKIAVNGDILYLGTTAGVFSYDTLNSTWGATFSSSNVTGWTAPNTVNSLVYHDSTLYVGTTGGLIIVPISGATAQTYTANILGPISSNIKSLNVASKAGVQDKLYVGHDHGFSVLGLQTLLWEVLQDTSNYASLTSSVSALAIDRSIQNNETLFFGGTAGVFGYFYGSGSTGGTYSVIPSSAKVTNLLFSYPTDDSIIYSSNQDMIFEFSKPMTTTSFESRAVLKAGITGTGATVSGIWVWTNNNRTGIFQPAAVLDKASPYYLTVALGSTAADNTYLQESIDFGFYTEDIAPVLGWKPIGKVLMLSGSSEDLTPGIYLRNPHDFDVEITMLIGR